MRRRLIAAAAGLAVAGLLWVGSVTGASAEPTFVNFETVAARPLALSPDGSQLFAVNTPDDRLEIFDVSPGGLTHVESVAVGMQPTAVAARTNTEVWVVNHLSDSVSIVDLTSSPARVVRTLYVGDEPWDIVFGGPKVGGTGPFQRAFIAAARRGQNHPEDPNHTELKTEGLGRADVWVFDATNLGASLGGVPEEIVTVFGDRPRGLAVTPDGATVYVGIFNSGNQTASVNPGGVCDGGFARGQCTVANTNDAADPPLPGVPGEGFPPILPGGLPPPNVDSLGNPQPETGLIVKWNDAAAQWQDELGRNFNGAVAFSLPDEDVFAIDALANPPAQTAAFAHVGTTIFGLAVNPANGHVYVANTDARNEVRFIGPGNISTTVRGQVHKSQVTVISGASVTPRHLNKHIDYALNPVPAGVKVNSLAQPVGVTVSPDGSKLYVSAFGSQKLGVFDTAQLEADTFVPSSASHIALSGGGPAGAIVDPANNRLYVHTRFDNGISLVDLTSETETGTVSLHNPEPPVITAGRVFLYDANFSSSNGEVSCGTCHVFGDMDQLAWDLGDPEGAEVPNANPFRDPPPGPPMFHPLKGPMTTQTLKGLTYHGPLHWRGDQTGLNDPQSNDPFDVHAGFKQFNGAFDPLMARDEGPIPDAQMDAFADFALTMELPPNPIGGIDGVPTASEALGRNIYFNEQTSGNGTCNSCHTLDPSQSFFGTEGLTAGDDGGPEELKIPQLRNVYEKIGMFGPTFFNASGNSGFDLGDQIRGYGVANDGSFGSVQAFFSFGFTFNDGLTGRQAIEDFVFSYPGDLTPTVGQQVTLTPTSGGDVHARIDVLRDRAMTEYFTKDRPNGRWCDLVVKGNLAGEARGWQMNRFTGQYASDRAADAPLTDFALRALAATPGQELTFTCVPSGSGRRMGIDRDLDGTLDRDELDNGSDPLVPDSALGQCSDGVDNDLDGLTDFADPGCGGNPSANEAPACNDGIDNDGDGDIDLADKNCETAAGTKEKQGVCGIGFELAFLLPPLMRMHRRRRRRS